MKRILILTVIVLLFFAFFRVFAVQNESDNGTQVSTFLKWNEKDVNVQISKVRKLDKQFLIYANVEFSGNDHDIVYIECLELVVLSRSANSINVQDEQARKLAKFRSGLSYKGKLWSKVYWTLNSGSFTLEKLNKALKKNDFQIVIKENCPLIATEYGIKYWESD